VTTTLTFLSYYLGRLWSGIVWLFTGSPVTQEPVLRQANSRDFNAHFRSLVTGAAAGLNLYEGDSFFQMCDDARRMRRPVVIMAIRNRTNVNAHHTVE
jgi:hypothetical protein